MSTKKFCPVIRCYDPNSGGIDHALHNTKIALNNGADGIFLLGGDLDEHPLVSIYDQVRKQHPEAWIGISSDIKGATSSRRWDNLYRRCRGLNAIWTKEVPYRVLDVGDIKVFAGEAFPYMELDQPDEELRQQCLNVTSSGLVPAIGGEDTGITPDFGKLWDIKRFLRNQVPMAITSGVNEKSIFDLLPIADHFFVLHSIGEIDKRQGKKFCLLPKAVKTLADLIHQDQTEME